MKITIEVTKEQAEILKQCGKENGIDWKMLAEAWAELGLERILEKQKSPAATSNGADCV